MRKIFKASVLSIVFILLILFNLTSAKAQVAVTGSLKSVVGGNLTGTGNFVRFRLRNYQGNIPRSAGAGCIGVIPSTQIDVTPDGSGNISTNLCGNDVITPNGTFYTLEFWSGGLMRVSADFIITGSGFNFNSAAPITVPPIVVPPTGDTTYQRLDGGNNATGSYVPSVDNAVDLGSTTVSWRNLYSPIINASGNTRNYNLTLQTLTPAISASAGNININTGSGNVGKGGDITVTLGAGTGGTFNGGAFSLTTGAGAVGGAGGNYSFTGGAGNGAGLGSAYTVTAGQGGATAAGGAISLTAGAGGATSGAGGALPLKAGNATAGNSAGGAASLSSGNSSGTGNGSDANVTAGNGGATSIAGGNANLNGGTTAAAGTGSPALVQAGGSRANGQAGDALIQAGNAGTLGRGGNINIFAGTGAGAGGTINVTAGQGGTSGGAGSPGGSIVISAASANSAGSVGGNVTLQPGQGNGAGAPGSIIIKDAFGAAQMGVTEKKGSGLGNYTTTSATYVDVQTGTELQIATVVPINFKAVITFSYSGSISAGAGLVAIADGTTVLKEAQDNAVNVNTPNSMHVIFTGDGNSHTFKPRYNVSGGNTFSIVNTSATLNPEFTVVLLPSN